VVLVVRWEKTTRPFLRGAEFLWQEGHCLFETREEAEKNVKTFLDIYDDCGRDLLAIPFMKGGRPNTRKFAGALATYTVEALMHDGKALQSGTSHLLGQGFAKAFGITFQGRNNALETPWQTSGALRPVSSAPSSWSMAMIMAWSCRLRSRRFKS
jgi:prolyl-tRNA synthetase